ncbi:hypothetical protein FRX31_002955 [Thalictrum thalictroides]|uniref:Uncharacterized protein n=1 Tax=Thalictrum thalictroides TaxID=46969 RepID=A0A7J6XEV4_THATH|nr:hypothetical protein FRX31_002955 [Thalictrum thalictroides]
MYGSTHCGENNDGDEEAASSNHASEGDDDEEVAESSHIEEGVNDNIEVVDVIEQDPVGSSSNHIENESDS